MSAILGIDYGTKHIGVSIATTPLAEPLTTLDNTAEVISKISHICRIHSTEKVIVGVSEGSMAEQSRAFGNQLSETLKTPVEYHDETLTSYEAKQKLRHAKKNVRNAPQDAFQATVMLQDYLDTQPIST